MKKLVSVIVGLAYAFLAKLRPHPCNPRQLRFDKGIDRSIHAVGWLPKTDELTGTVDRPVVTKSGLIVRGLARLGTILLGCKSEDEKIAKFYKELVNSGKVELLVIPDNLPAATFRRIASDSDASKTAWNRAEAFRQWRDFVLEDGISPTVASMLVGHTARRQTYEELLKCPPAMVDAWIASAAGDENAVYVKDADVSRVAKAVTAFRAVNPSAAADEYGQDAGEIVNSILTGKPVTVAKLTATRQEIQEAAAIVKTLKRTFAAADVADCLLTLAGFDGDTVVAVPKGHFSRYIRKIAAADIAAGKPKPKTVKPAR